MHENNFNLFCILIAPSELMAPVVTNKEVYASNISMSKSPKATAQYPIDDSNISQEEHDTILYKFKSLISSREYYRKKSDLETWENLTFHSYTAPLSTSIPRKKRITLDPGLELFCKVSISESRNFSEEITHDSRMHLLDFNLQTSRSRLSILLDQWFSNFFSLRTPQAGPCV
ncbi:hypothetical protein LOD99_4715 [Oopsacas minuta]|uniref:Uncharacterized protein n=1 Tax=Oopsacas minuta TaxID=111878 RepID=A0AAV7JUF4_9METZ|nr:hypothetical protein LOD99_4715 [Oopsacas minuta]